jgi:hypothetical protein
MASMGGSRLMYKLIGILLMIIGILVATDLYRTAFISLFGWLFGIKNPQEDVYTSLIRGFRRLS